MQKLTETELAMVNLVIAQAIDATMESLDERASIKVIMVAALKSAREKINSAN